MSQYDVIEYRIVVIRCGKTKIPPILKKREKQIDGFPRFVEPSIDAPCVPFFRSNVFKCRVHCGPGYKSTVPRVKCRKGELKNPAKGILYSLRVRDPNRTVRFRAEDKIAAMHII